MRRDRRDVHTPQAVEKLFGTLRLLASTGCSILYISHKLDEIRALCHRCTVLRAGKVVGTCDPMRETTASLSRMMVGSEPPPLEHREQKEGAVALSLRRLDLPRSDRFGVDLHDLSLSVRRGELVGIAGVSGNGQRELLAAISGEDPGAPADAILLGDRPVGGKSPQQRRKLGLHFVPEERLGRGAVPAFSLANNMLLTRRESLRLGGWIDRSFLGQQTRGILGRFAVEASGPGAVAKSLSGGNLQKYIVGREIDAVPKVLIVAQPTWGVDVGTAAQIRGELLALDWQAVDWEKRTIRVERQLQYLPSKGLIIRSLKTKSSYRTLPLPDVTYQALQALHKEAQKSLIFSTGAGTPYYSRNILRTFHRLLEQMDLPIMPFHNLRHSCASFHLALGTNPRVVAELRAALGDEAPGTDRVLVEDQRDGLDDDARAGRHGWGGFYSTSRGPRSAVRTPACPLASAYHQR